MKNKGLSLASINFVKSMLDPNPGPDQKKIILGPRHYYLSIFYLVNLKG
jgi:hypothetical protein